MPKTRGSSSPKMRKPRSTEKQPTQGEIALRAYHIYLQRNGAPGNPLDDWTRAERELLEENGKVGPKAALKSIAA